MIFDEYFANAIKKKLIKKYNGFIPSEHEYYSHPTFTVTNLADYIRIISEMSVINSKLLFSDAVVFRGMPDSDYDLRPGLARIDNKEFNTESAIINDFLTKRPDEFRGLSEFDTIAKMQHYGLPTRLLDFSLNPLVALYFACESKTRKTGRVLCHSTILQNDSSDYVNKICTSAINEMLDEFCTLDESLCNDKLSLQRYLYETYIFDETTVVRPKYWNQRIANQAGVFMVFPNDVFDRYRSILIHADEIGLDKSIEEYGRGKIDRVALKEAYLKEPIDYYKKESSENLTDECFEMMIAAYKDEEESCFRKRMNERFNIAENIKPLSKRKINNDFCSILIQPKDKKKILRDLSYIGFGMDYIYPELEYTAQEIKRRFEF